MNKIFSCRIFMLYGIPILQYFYLQQLDNVLELTWFFQSLRSLTGTPGPPCHLCQRQHGDPDSCLHVGPYLLQTTLVHSITLQGMIGYGAQPVLQPNGYQPWYTWKKNPFSGIFSSDSWPILGFQDLGTTNVATVRLLERLGSQVEVKQKG